MKLNISLDTIDSRWGHEAPPEEVARITEFYESRFEHYGYDARIPKNRAVIARYAAKYRLGMVGKGLALIGAPGRGKTLAMKILSRLFSLRMLAAQDLVETWRRYGIRHMPDFWAELRGYHWHDEKLSQLAPGYDHMWKDVIIDDIGTEPTMNHYGTRSEVIDEILTKRVRAYEDYQAFTHITCNLPLINEAMDNECIQGRYGERLVSRLHQICHVVSLAGPDRRIEP